MKPCRVDACERRVRKAGLCHGHLRRGENGTVAPRRSALARDQQGRKHCRTCDQWLAVDNFTKDHRGVDGLRSICLNCHASLRRARAFGVGSDWFDRQFKAQGEACAICRSPEPRGRGWAIDHDHKCCPESGKSCGQCVRGVLCSPCNLALGMFGDRVEDLHSAIGYLERMSVVRGV